MNCSTRAGSNNYSSAMLSPGMSRACVGRSALLVRDAMLGVGDQDADSAAVAGGVQRGRRSVDDLGVDVDADDAAFRPDDLGDVGRVQPAGANLQHGHAGT